MFRSILCATDFSPGGSHAVELAATWAEATRSALEVLHVVTPFVTLAPETSFLTELRAMIRSDAEGKLEALVASLTPRVKATGRVVDGFADTQIVAEARARGADLIVVGTSGQRSFSRALLGSTADRVVRTSDVGVLAVPRDASTTLPTAIVAATDLAAPSQRAVAVARELGALLHAEVHVALGYELPFFTDPESDWARDLPRALDARVRAFHELDARAHVHVSPREASEAIARVVDASHAGLVVMAGGGRSHAAALLLGSVTDRVLRRSRTPVLVLREADPNR